jgi:hypothetical protein
MQYVPAAKPLKHGFDVKTCPATPAHVVPMAYFRQGFNVGVTVELEIQIEPLVVP